MSFDAPTLADFEDVVRQMVQNENLLRGAIGPDAVLRRRHKLVDCMHHAIDRITAECRADDEKETASVSAVAVPTQRIGSSLGQPAPTGGVR